MIAPTLRAAAPADAAPLARLGRESFVAKFGHLYRAEDLSAFLGQTFTTEAIASELANPCRLYRLAQHAAGALAGYCKLGLACAWPELARGKNAIELKQLYTDPALTGHGIGAALLEWAITESRARGADEIQLSVWSGNSDAQRFYARHGFSRVGDTTFLVGSHVDEEFVFARRV